MSDLNLNLYALLGIVEVLLLLLSLAVALSYQLRRARRDTSQLREQLQQAQTEVRREVIETVVEAPAAPQRDYADFLREELGRSNQLLGEDAPSQAEGAPVADAQTGTEALARQMLAARHQFLQLELDVQGVASTADGAVQRQTVIAGMQALLDGLRPLPAAAPETAASESEEQVPDVPLPRSEVNRLQDQISHLRSVIDNQHSVMRELRHLLEEHGGESEQLQEALRKLGDAEAQGVELQRCLEVMEHENERLKHTVTAEGGAAPGAGPDADMLRDLVGSQQRTISKLQHMLQSLAPDSGKAKELGDAINKIQRANSELNSCVMVLEDENAMLRGQLESLQERLAGLEANAAQESESAADSQLQAAASVDDIDALLEQAAAEIPAVQQAVASATPAVADDGDAESLDTDDLLAELFGTARDGAAGGKTG